jgi:hypothetical protein
MSAAGRPRRGGAKKRSFASPTKDREQFLRLLKEARRGLDGEARAACDRGVPRYVERELRAYLACGIHAHGFLRARYSRRGLDRDLARLAQRRATGRAHSAAHSPAEESLDARPAAVAV